MMSKNRRHTTAARILSMVLCFLLVLGTAAGEAYAAEQSTGNPSAFDAPHLLSETETAENAGNTASLAGFLMEKARATGNGLRSNTGGYPWDSEGKKFSWTYYNGIMMDAFLMLDSERYISDVKAFYEGNLTVEGRVNSAGSQNNYYREKELDSVPPARALFDLLRRNDLSQLQRSTYLKCLQYVYSVMRTFEARYVLSNTGGNFYHKPDNANWSTYQFALDGLYMAQPFYMELANALEDGTLDTASFPDAVPSDIYNAVADRMIWAGEALYNQNTQLYNHGWGTEAGVNGQYWLRAVGWYAAALADVISMLPDQYENKKERLIDLETRLFKGMMERQDPETGMWYNVINYGPELTGTRSSNKFESSGSALLSYAMMKSYVEGYVGYKYGEAGLKAFNGTVEKELEFTGTGAWFLHDTYISSGVESTPQGYLTKSYASNEAKGVGPLIMASTYAVRAAEIYHHPDSVEILNAEGRTVAVGQEPDFSGIELDLQWNDSGLPADVWTVPSKDLGFSFEGDQDLESPGPKTVSVWYNGSIAGTFTVTFEAEPVFYQISTESTVSGSLTTDMQEAEEKTTVTVTALPDPGFVLKSLTWSGESVSDQPLSPGSQENKYVFTMPAENVTVRAVFGRPPVSLACDSENTRNSVLKLQKMGEGGSYEDVNETLWEDLDPGAYRLRTTAPAALTRTTENEELQVVYDRGSWKEYYFSGGIETGTTDNILGEYLYYFDLDEDAGALTIRPDGEYPMAALSMENDTPVSSVEILLTVDGEDTAEEVWPAAEDVDPVLLEKGRTYRVFSDARLVFTGADVTDMAAETDPETGNTAFIYTVQTEEGEGSGSSVVISKEAPVFIELSSGAEEICTDYETPDGRFSVWSGSGTFTAGSFAFYEMSEELVIEGAENLNEEESEDGYTYTFTADPGARITIRLASEPEYVFEPMASITLTEAAAESLTWWENEYESGYAWETRDMYPAGSYTFTFTGEAQISGCDSSQVQEDGLYTCTFTLGEGDMITIDVSLPQQEPSAAVSLSDAVLEKLTGWSLDGEAFEEWDAEASHAPGFYSFRFSGKALITGADFEETEAGGVYTYTFTAGDGDVIYIDAAQEAERRPAFRKQSLRLSGDIGVDFYLDLSMLTEEERQASYMTFQVGQSAETVTADYRSDFLSRTGEYYGFTCFVTSIQMADQIKAVYHYGQDSTITKTYSVKEYISYIHDHADDFKDETLQALVHAIADYGHYVQPFLAKTNKWNLGKDYAEMDGYTDLKDADVEAARAGTKGKAFIRDLSDSQIEAMTYALNLVSETSIRIFVKVKDGYSGEVTAKMGGTSLPCQLQNDGRWRIEITGIPAHRLADTYQITVQADRECSCSVSAMAYVSTVLNSENEVLNNDMAHYAVTSLYNYYAETLRYRQAHNM